MRRLLLYSTFICGALLLGSSGQQPESVLPDEEIQTAQSQNSPSASVTCYATVAGGPVTFGNISIHGIPTGSTYTFSESNITYNWISIDQISYVIPGAIVTKHYDNSNPPVEIGPPTVTPTPISGVAVVVITASKLPQGEIVTTGQETGYDSCFAPSRMRGIECGVYSYGEPLSYVVVTTETMGTVISEAQQGNGQIYVPLAVSNTGCTISFHTTSPEGGGCSWTGVGN